MNNGIQPPVVTVSSTTGVGGTGIPGARIHVLIQQRPPVLGDPDLNVEGTTFPSTPSIDHRRGRRHLGHHVPQRR